MHLSLQQYEESLAALSLRGGEGVRLTCPSCSSAFWIRLPKQPIDYFRDSIYFACPGACGFGGELPVFHPEPLEGASEFDTSLHCRRCGLEFAADGAVLRKPCCPIETPRELMGELVNSVREEEGGTPTRAELEALLERLVATFDGLMRRMLEIAHANEKSLGIGPKVLQLPTSSSFQNLSGAQNRFLTAKFDMSAIASDWQNLIRLFQRRHVIAHRLGVMDEAYIIKSGDPTAVVGKKVPLSIDEIRRGAEDYHRIVIEFFGIFLS